MAPQPDWDQHEAALGGIPPGDRDAILGTLRSANRRSQRFADEGDAVAYWLQFPVNVTWEKPGQELVGTLEHLDREKAADGTWAPKLKIRGDDGIAYYVTARQTKLLAELVRTAPVVGDRIKIVYAGPATKAAPGMSPTKEFQVRVRPPKAAE